MVFPGMVNLTHLVHQADVNLMLKETVQIILDPC